MLGIDIEQQSPPCAKQTARDMELYLQRCGSCLDMMAALYDQWQGQRFIQQIQGDTSATIDVAQGREQLMDVMALYHDYAEDARLVYSQATALVGGRPLVDRTLLQGYKLTMKHYRQRFAELTRYCQALLSD